MFLLSNLLMPFKKPILATFLISLCMNSLCNAHLSLGYYKKTCPNAEAIVKRETAKIMAVAPTLAAPFLRLHFHDCFVRGCDASLLLNATRSNPYVEKDDIPNRTLRGFGSIDRVKAAVEKECPGVVSCADILALVTRDAISLMKGPYWAVPLGRRDGRVSNGSEVLANLPDPRFNFTQLRANFAAKGLNSKDLVVLSGGHTIGTSQCSSFYERLYNFRDQGVSDPALDPNYAARLKSKCNGNNKTLAEMDPGSFKTFDTSYYNLIAKRRGLFASDSSLLSDRTARAYVTSHSTSKGAPSFFKDFATSMVKMGQIGVLVGTQGEIRKQCAFVN